MLLGLALMTFAPAARAGTKPNGDACAGPSECASGFCADGVCCASACSGQCEACNVLGAEGTCSPVIGAPKSGRPACSDGGTDTCAATQCDGVDRTKCAGFVGSEVVCSAASCKDGVMTPESRCDGLGTCPTVISIACAFYGCDVDRCKTSCTSKADCASNATCAGGKCVPVSPTCSPDMLSAIAADGTTVSCAPYKCVGGECLAACAPGRNSDCQDGLVCTNDRRCEAPAPASPTSSDGGGGCASGRAGRSGGLAAFGAVVALAAFARTRRRR